MIWDYVYGFEKVSTRNPYWLYIHTMVTIDNNPVYTQNLPLWIEVLTLDFFIQITKIFRTVW